MPSPLSGAVDQATADQYTQDQAPGAQLVGGPGLAHPQGRLRLEGNPKYLSQNWWRREVPKLRRCAPVATAWKRFLDVVMSAWLEVQETNPDPAATEWLCRQLGLEGYEPEMDDTAESMWRRVFPAVAEGARYFEWVTHVGRDGRRYCTYLHDRPMVAIEAFVHRGGRLVGIKYRTQEDLGTSRLDDIPVSQLLTLIWEPQQSDDWEGLPLWRAIAEEAADFTEVRNLLRDGARTFALGKPIVHIDTEIADRAGAIKGDPEKWHHAEQAAADGWADRYYDGEEGLAGVPSWWRIDWVSPSQGYDPEKLVAQATANAETIHQHHGTEGVMVGGTQASGSYDAVRVKAESITVAAQNVWDWALGQLHRQVLAPLLRFNFPNLSPERWPRLQAVGLRAPIWIEKLAETIQAGGQGQLGLTESDWNYMRRGLGFRARGDGETPLVLSQPVAQPGVDAANTGKRGKGQ